MKKTQKVSLTINDREIKAKEGMTILDAARDAGIYIPTLCYHEKLAPYGACRICTVEVSKGKKNSLVTSCVYPVEEGLVVNTVARQYAVTQPRFKAEKTNCILCGLCVRYCNEIKKANAIGFVGRGTERRVVFYPQIASTVCASCRECFRLCPTGKLPSETDGVCFDDLTLEDFLSARQATV
jgi:NADH dehydrogenase/NADH:ubiquinone oxidoreductase subunit G